jgi:hypothetical protein
MLRSSACCPRPVRTRPAAPHLPLREVVRLQPPALVRIDQPAHHLDLRDQRNEGLARARARGTFDQAEDLPNSSLRGQIRLLWQVRTLLRGFSPDAASALRESA